MKPKTFLRKLRTFAKKEDNQTIIFDFIDRFEKTIIINSPIIGRLTKESYAKYLETPVWKEIRRKVLTLKGKKCEKCGTTTNLNVHHTVYSKKVLAGKTLRGLRVVCRQHHEEIHALVKTGLSLRKATNQVLDKDKIIKISEKAKLKKLGTIAYFKQLEEKIDAIS